MSIATNHRTVVEYFEVEFASEERHEYVDGEVTQMVGGSSPRITTFVTTSTFLSEKVAPLPKPLS